MKAVFDDVSLAYDDTGSGPAVVLLHGFPFNRQLWRPQARALAKAGYRVVTPDLRGFGESTLGDGIAGIKTFADDLLALLDYLGIGRAVIGGMSMGGYVVLEFLARYPRRCAAALLMVTRAGADDAAGRERRTALAARARQQGAAPVAAAFETVLFDEHTPAARPELVSQVRDWMLATPAETLAAALEAMRDRSDFHSRLAEFTCPALVLGAAGDRTIPVEESRRMAAALPAGTVRILPDGGHLVNLEEPASVNETLLEFLRNLSCQ